MISTDASSGSAVFLAASFAAAISSLPGRSFLPGVFGRTGTLFSFSSFDGAGAAVVLILASLAKSVSVLIPAVGGAEAMEGCSVAWVCSSDCASFTMTVDRAGGVGRTGTTGLIVAPLVTFRCGRGGAG